MDNLKTPETEVIAQEEAAPVETEKKKSAKDFFIKVGKSVKEFFRKLMVSLKRRPHNVALVMLAVSLIVYSVNLNSIAQTTANINTRTYNMGLCEFATMLFSILVIVCFLNAFPKRQKPKIFMIVMIFLMIVAIIACDAVYFHSVSVGIANALNENPPRDLGSEEFIIKARSVLIAHIVLTSISAVLTATIPLYGKLFKKIKTSVEVEYTEADEEVELAEE